LKLQRDAGRIGAIRVGKPLRGVPEGRVEVLPE